MVRPTIAIVDHEKEGAEPLIDKIGALKSSTKLKSVAELFRLVPVIVEPSATLASDAHSQILAECGTCPDLVLVDQSFGNQTDALETGRDLALALRESLGIPLGVYSKYEIPEYQRFQLSSDGFAVVLDQLAMRDYSASPNMKGDQWVLLFEKICSYPNYVGSVLSRTENKAAEIPQKGNDSDKLRIALEELNPSQVLTAMRPRGWHGVYVIGSFDKRITLYNQQTRALTLVRALLEDEDLRAGESVAVIGGGVAGATAAMACTAKGCSVDLYERRDTLVHLQGDSAHRYLHPHIFSWPAEGSCDLDAGLPILNWTADYANAVGDKLRDEFLRYQRDNAKKLNINLGAKITKIEKTGVPGKRVRLTGNKGNQEADIEETYHVVVIATGHGLDQNQPSTRSYWSPDAVTAGHNEDKRTILVSGSGDGGLTDLGRATLKGFRHDEIVRELSGMEELGREMLKIDDAALRAYRHNGTIPNLRKLYESLEIGEDVVSWVKSRKRSDTDVTFCFRKPGMFSIESALINRLLAVLLIKAEVVKQRHAEVREDAVEPLNNGRYRVQFSNDDTEDEYDLVILRHGPKVGTFGDLWPDIEKDCSELSGKIAELKLTGALSGKTFEWYC